MDAFVWELKLNKIPMNGLIKNKIKEMHLIAWEEHLMKLKLQINKIKPLLGINAFKCILFHVVTFA